MKFLTVFFITLCFMTACGGHKDHDHEHEHDHEHTHTDKNANKPVSKDVSNKTVSDEDKEIASRLSSRIFDDLNCEGGDIISPFEVDEHFSAVFLPVDSNQDRAISLEELGKFYHDLSPEMVKKSFAKGDRNNDGVMSSAEYREYLLETLISLDENHDDELSRQEVTQYR